MSIFDEYEEEEKESLFESMPKKKGKLKLNPNYKRHIPTDEDREEEINEMKDSIIDGVEGDR